MRLIREFFSALTSFIGWLITLIVFFTFISTLILGFIKEQELIDGWLTEIETTGQRAIIKGVWCEDEKILLYLPESKKWLIKNLNKNCGCDKEAKVLFIRKDNRCVWKK